MGYGAGLPGLGAGRGASFGASAGGRYGSGVGSGYGAGYAAWGPLSLGPSLAAWYRADISYLWQDAARTTPVAADGDPIGCWDDASGNGFHLKQSSDALRPTYKANIQSNKPVVRFNGTSQYLVAAHAARLSMAQHVYTFAACKFPAVGAIGFFSKGKLGSHFNYGMVRKSNGLSAAYNNGTLIGPAITNYKWCYFDTDQAAAQTVFGISGVDTTVTGSPDSLTTGTGELYLGVFGSTTTPTQYFGGDVGEIILAGTVAGTTIPADAKVNARAYLNAQWVIPTSVVVFEGDSITAYANAPTSGEVGYPALTTYAILPNPLRYNFAVSGNTLSDISARGSTVDATFATHAGVGKRVLVILTGANDNGNATFTADLKTYCLARKAATPGLKIVIIPTLPRDNGAFNTWRNARNVEVAADTSFYDSLAVQDSSMWDDADAADTAKYSDGIHPTEAGQALIYPLVKTAVEAVL